MTFKIKSPRLNGRGKLLCPIQICARIELSLPSSLSTCSSLVIPSSPAAAASPSPSSLFTGGGGGESLSLVPLPRRPLKGVSERDKWATDLGVFLSTVATCLSN